MAGEDDEEIGEPVEVGVKAPGELAADNRPGEVAIDRIGDRGTDGEATDLRMLAFLTGVPAATARAFVALRVCCFASFNKLWSTVN